MVDVGGMRLIQVDVYCTSGTHVTFVYYRLSVKPRFKIPGQTHLYEALPTLAWSGLKYPEHSINRLQWP